MPATTTRRTRSASHFPGGRSSAPCRGASGSGRAMRAASGPIALLLLCAAAAPARAGGRAECLAAWRVGGTEPATGVVCRDGDPACDADGAADGACVFDVALCLNAITTAPGCAAGTLARVKVRGGTDAALAASVAALPLPVDGLDTCTSTARVRVPLGHRMRLRALAAEPAPGRVDRDRLRLTCVPREGPGRAVIVSTNFET